jgi:hypothetical protein
MNQCGAVVPLASDIVRASGKSRNVDVVGWAERRLMGGRKVSGEHVGGNGSSGVKGATCANMSEYLIASGASLQRSVHGGFSVNRRPSNNPDVAFARLLKPAMASMPDGIETGVYTNIYIDQRNWHSLPVFMRYGFAGLTQPSDPTATPAEADTRGHGHTPAPAPAPTLARQPTVRAFLHPIPRRWDTTAAKALESGTDMVVTVFLLLALSFVPASFVLILVSERASRSRHLQCVVVFLTSRLLPFRGLLAACFTSITSDGSLAG